MTVEIALYPSGLDTTLPTASDFVSEGDDHLRLIKTVLKTWVPNMNGAWNATPTEANYIVGVTSPIQTQINTKGAITGQTWTGTHVFPSTTTIGALTPTIRGYLETVTSDAQAQITARSIKAGDTYSGVHNYTGATINVPTLVPGSTGNGAASVDFVNTAAFSAALPGQTGSAGKFVTTNGSSASWAFPFLKEQDVTGTSVSATAGNCYVLKNVAATTVTLPASPADGDCISVFCANRLLTNVISRNGNNICGLAEDMTIDNPYLPVQLRYRSTTGWDIIL